MSHQIARFFAFFSLFSLSTALFAGDKSSGCGAGWFVFKDTSLVSSSLRATTNATFLNTLGMTSGTSGCAKHKLVKKEFKGIHFVEANKEMLLVEMARGEGEYLSGLSEVMGCSNRETFSRSVKDSYGTLVEHAQNASSLYQALRSHCSTHSLI